MTTFLLSLPSNLVEPFYDITHYPQDSFFCTSDPVGNHLGSGGGTIWLLERCCEYEHQDFNKWIGKEKRVLIHAGGESRRLPSYASTGNILIPIPIFRWERGQALNQNLLSLQLPFYQKLLKNTPQNINTLIASGDVLIRAKRHLPQVPDADIVCLGLWVDSTIAKTSDVLVAKRETPDKLEFLLHNPDFRQLEKIIQTHVYMMNMGVWLLSDRAVKVLQKRSKNKKGEIGPYELCTEFGMYLGRNPSRRDKEINSLSVSIMPFSEGEFYHFGTSRELISSSLAIQNEVKDQTKIFHHRVKPHPSIFIQNSEVKVDFTGENSDIWIENSYVSENWGFNKQHVLTGIPENNWNLFLPKGVCIDIIPYEKSQYIVRPYGFDDPLGSEFVFTQDYEVKDLFTQKLYPICNNTDEIYEVLQWMIIDKYHEVGRALYDSLEKCSADEILHKSNLYRLFEQRERLCARSIPRMANNYNQSVFYNTDLDDMAKEYIRHGLELPAPIPECKDVLRRIHNASLRTRIMQYRNQDFEEEADKAFEYLRHGLRSTAEASPVMPVMDVYPEQMVWGRSPVRIDLAGGWSDTPPYCLMEGGKVVNMAIEMNGQLPLQVYIRPSSKYKIILQSINNGIKEELKTFADINNFRKVRSFFSIPKAALALCGFVPEFCTLKYVDLQDQLKTMGCGLEITMSSASPLGTGLGTGSILAATIFAALSDFCNLGWNKTDVCNRTLVLEQLLTSGNGWQDQYGGVIQGLKMLHSYDGFNQTPSIKWLPNNLFTDPDYQKCHLLFYSGIKGNTQNALVEIVRKIFLNDSKSLAQLREIKRHAEDMADTIQSNDFQRYGHMISLTRQHNQMLAQTNDSPEVQRIIHLIEDYCLGYKYPGAGDGIFIYMVAKDPGAASKIKETLMNNRVNDKSRFIDISLSARGMEISRS